MFAETKEQRYWVYCDEDRLHCARSPCPLGRVVPLIEALQSHWRCLKGADLVALVRAGATFKKGVLVEGNQEVAARSVGPMHNILRFLCSA